MKNVFFALAFMLVGTFAFASNLTVSDLSSVNLKSFENQDCNEYAANAANQEVGWIENWITGGNAYLQAYSFWLGYCEGTSAVGAYVLNPVFIEG